MAVSNPMPLEVPTPTPAPAAKSLKGLLRWAWHSWATRSLAIGGLATGLDIGVLLICVVGLGLPNAVGAAVGVVFGAFFTYFANKHFAFKDYKTPAFGPAFYKFLAATACSMVVHAS